MHSYKAILLAAVTSLTPLTHAQPFPNKPLTMVVPYPPGGANDMLGRLLGQKMSENLNQAVVVENKAGAGAMIGANFVAKSAPDGYTLLVGGLATHAASPNLSKADYNPLTDFESVGLIGSAPIILITYNDSPYKSLADVVTDAKKKAGNVMYASSGNGSPLHLAGQLFASTYNLDITHVPYKGGTAHMLDLMGGRVGVVFDTATNAMSYLKGGKVRALAVSTPKRLPDLPNVPTFAESGYEKFDFTAWYGLFAAGKTPKDVVAKLSVSLATALKNPEVIDKLKGVGVSTASGDAAELAKLVPAEHERIGKLIKSANIKAD